MGSDPGLHAAPAARGQTPIQLHGRTVDARTGAPLGDVLVTLDDAGRAVKTDADGRFAFDGLSPGPHRLSISVVGYTFVRRTVDAAADGEITIALAEGTSAYSETVTVTPDAFRPPPEPLASAQVLGNAELLNLRGVLADDPLRAVQALPGVATGDDLRSEFTVRGSDFRHITFTVDGFETPYLLHTVRGIEDRGPAGSLAMINSDVLDQVSLLNGGYAQRYAGHTGAEVDFRLREGSRDGRRVNAAASATAASAVAEGPIGRAHRGSWLVSGRKSYLDLLVHRLTSDAVSFGFSDAQAKAAYDVSARQQLELTLLAGRSRFDNDPAARELDDVYVGENASAVGVGAWRLTHARGIVTQRVLAARNHFRNTNASGVELDRGSDRQLAYRVDSTTALARRVQLDAGASAERLDDERLRRRLSPNRLSLVEIDNYAGDGVRTGAYVTSRVLLPGSVTVSPGARVERWTLGDQTAGSPWVQGEWKARERTAVRASAGVYQQVSDFDRVLGVSGGTNLRPERATQYDAGIEQRLSRSTRTAVTVYDREDDDMLRSVGGETRLVGNRVVRGLRTAVYANRLDGYARGIELLLQRSATSGVSGWISYAFARNRYSDQVTGESFWGDADQRHTLNAYASYRRSDRLSFAAKLRVGSNFPAPGYYTEQDGAYFVTNVRNTLRLPAYARLDLRANRAYTWPRRRLTIFAEVINVLNRSNVRFDPPSVNTVTHRTGDPFERMIPIVPSVGVLLEFR